MVVIKLQKTLDKLDKTKYWLSKESGIAENNIYKMCKGESKQIKLETIDRLIKVLDCELTDIIEYIPDKE